MSSSHASAEPSLPLEAIQTVVADNRARATISAVATPVAQLLSTQQSSLLQRIAESNTPGNLEGLFAFHVLGHESVFPITWDVNCATEEWLASNTSRLSNAPMLAELGYALYHFSTTASQDMRQIFAASLEKLRLRNPFPEDHMSFAYRPVEFLGLALGSLALRDAGSSYRAWLTEVLADPRHVSASTYHALLFGYSRYRLTGESNTVHDLRSYRSVEELALVEWSIRQGALYLSDPRATLSDIQAKLLQAALSNNVSNLDVPRAAILWSAVNASLTRTVDELVLSKDHVAIVLRRFEAALRRWRWDDPQQVKKHPIRWAISSEREVQDIVWLILRSLFDDVVDEETLPKIGHSTYRADFGIPSLRLLVEAKYTRQAGDFKKIEKEIMEDAVAYLLETSERYDRILVFIYDHSSSVQEHELTASTLRKIPAISDVIIVSRPSQLPFADEEQSE